MTNQLLKSPDNIIQQIGTLILIIALTILVTVIGGRYWQESDPYIKEVLSSPGDPTIGHAIFQINCAGCHGIDGQGKVGPSLQQVSKHLSSVNIIEQVISGKTPPMPQFQPKSSEMAHLLSYLETL